MTTGFRVGQWRRVESGEMLNDIRRAVPDFRLGVGPFRASAGADSRRQPPESSELLSPNASFQRRTATQQPRIG